MSDTPNKFKAGDLVKLKSGGPVMTVVLVDGMMGPVTKGGEAYKCKWFSGKKLEYAHFSEPSLVFAEDDTKQSE